MSVNGHPLHGLSHEEAISLFKSIRSGPVVLKLGRRANGSSSAASSSSSSSSQVSSGVSSLKKGYEMNLLHNPSLNFLPFFRLVEIPIEEKEEISFAT